MGNPLQRSIVNTATFMDESGNAQYWKDVVAFLAKPDLENLFAQEKLYRVEDVLGEVTSAEPAIDADRVYIEQI